MTPWCVVLVCSWRCLLADRHSLPFPWTLSLHRRWCPSASHHPLTFLFLHALTFPLPFPFPSPSLGLSLCRPQCPSASHHSFPSHSLGRLCQRSPRTCPVWVEVCRAPWWPPYPSLVRALDGVVRHFSGWVATRGKMSLPCSLLSASTLGLTTVVTPLRVRPPVGLRCHHPLTFLFLLALTFPLPSPFPSLGLSLCGPQCPSASPHSFPSLSLGRLWYSGHLGAPALRCPLRTLRLSRTAVSTFGRSFAIPR